jgi:uncharacterized protein (DUF302 family)
MNVDGLVARISDFDPATTMERLVAAVGSHGMTVLARIDHAADAGRVGLQLRPTGLLLFGNPRAGTPLMNAAQTIGIDLPLKALVWQDERGQTWLAYNEPGYLAKRHGITGDVEAILAGMARILAELADQTTARETGERS